MEKIKSVQLKDEDIAKLLFPDKKVTVKGISKRISNDGAALGWLIEYGEEQ